MHTGMSPPPPARPWIKKNYEEQEQYEQQLISGQLEDSDHLFPGAQHSPHTSRGLQVWGFQFAWRPGVYQTSVVLAVFVFRLWAL